MSDYLLYIIVSAMRDVALSMVALTGLAGLMGLFFPRLVERRRQLDQPVRHCPNCGTPVRHFPSVEEVERGLPFDKQ